MVLCYSEQQSLTMCTLTAMSRAGFPEVICRINARRGTWKGATFKEYNFAALGLPTAGGHLHPLLKARRFHCRELLF